MKRKTFDELIRYYEKQHEMNKKIFEIFMLPTNTVFLQTVEFLKELRAERARNCWIPCSEPPKNEGRYLVYVERMNKSFVDIDYFNGRYFCWGDYAKAWKTLPEPYKEKI
jgi:hypothetical protein